MTQQFCVEMKISSVCLSRQLSVLGFDFFYAFQIHDTARRIICVNKNWNNAQSFLEMESFDFPDKFKL